MNLDFTRGMILTENGSFHKSTSVSDLKPLIEKDMAILLVQEGTIQSFSLPKDDLEELYVLPQLWFQENILKKVTFHYLSGKCGAWEDPKDAKLEDLVHDFEELKNYFLKRVGKKPDSETSRSCVWHFAWGNLKSYYLASKTFECGISVSWKP